MSRASHPQSRQSIQIEAARLEQKIWPHFVAETRNEDEFLRAYIIDDRKKQVYIKLKELYWTLWRFIGVKRSWAIPGFVMRENLSWGEKLSWKNG